MHSAAKQTQVPDAAAVNHCFHKVVTHDPQAAELGDTSAGRLASLSTGQPREPGSGGHSAHARSAARDRRHHPQYSENPDESIGEERHRRTSKTHLNECPPPTCAWTGSHCGRHPKWRQEPRAGPGSKTQRKAQAGLSVPHAETHRLQRLEGACWSKGVGWGPPTWLLSVRTVCSRLFCMHSCCPIRDEKITDYNQPHRKLAKEAQPRKGDG